MGSAAASLMPAEKHIGMGDVFLHTRNHGLRRALLAFALMVAGITGVAARTAPAYADASCSGGVSVYGVLPDGRLTYTVIDPHNGNIQHIVVSTSTLGFTPVALATLNFNTLLVTSPAGVLYRVDVITNS